MKPYYEDDAVTLYHAPCEDVLPSLSGVDLVFTSPPYNLSDNPGGTGRSGSSWPKAALANGYEDHADAMPLPEYEAWQQECLGLMWATLTDDGAIFYNHKPRIQNCAAWLPLTLNPGLPLRQVVTWARAGGLNYGPTHFVPTMEWVLLFAKPDWRLKSQAASGIGDVWYIPQQPSDHPAPFPLGLPARAIEAAAPSLVLDPFAGSGTTLRAAADAGVPSIGIEKSERYCEMAVDRLRQGSLFGASS